MTLDSRAPAAILLAVALLAAACSAAASDVTLVGVFGKQAAILAVDGGPPRTVKLGQKLGGLTLIDVEGDRATVEIDGKRRVLARGQTYSTRSNPGDAQTAVLSAGAGGHFMAEGQINGGAIRFMVDTGATSIALPASDANRLRIDYRNGQRGTTRTASGVAEMYVVRLDRVRVGGIEILNVDAVIIEHGLDIALLGNTFLNRVEMRREGQTMTLIKKF
jgi:aspartyl protease family protein